MSWKRTVFFIFVLAALAAFYYAKLYQQPVQDRLNAFSIEAPQSYVLALKTGDAVKSLSIEDTAQQTAISFEKDSSDHWQITAPIQFPAEPLIVDGFVTLLKLTPRLRHLSTGGLNLDEFGFDKPRLKICLGTSDEPSRCLVIGGDSVIGESAYAKWENESTYFLLDPVFLKSFDKTLYSVRKKQIFTLPGDEISSIQFQSSKKEINLIQEGKHWTLKKPVESAVGPDAMEALLIELSGLYVKEFVDGEEAGKLKSKLKKPVRTIRILLRNGSEQILIQGKEAGGKDAYYASLNQPETVFLVSQGKLNHLEESFSKLTS